ncbi:hypothetical protein D3C79_890900 [compost metagenome]
MAELHEGLIPFDVRLQIGQCVGRTVIVEHLDHVSGLNSQRLGIVGVDFQISHWHATLYEIVVLVVVERLPHFVDASIVDPELVFRLLFCHRFR